MRSASGCSDEAEDLRTGVLNEPFQVDWIISNLEQHRARTSAHSARARSVENSSTIFLRLPDRALDVAREQPQRRFADLPLSGGIFCRPDFACGTSSNMAFNSE